MPHQQSTGLLGHVPLIDPFWAQQLALLEPNENFMERLRSTLEEQ